MKTFKVSERENEKEKKFFVGLAPHWRSKKDKVKENERRKVNEIKNPHAKAEIHKKKCVEKCR